jgi:hypothetical protein
MNKKILFPTILATTLLMAGMFAFTPIEKASTIHSSLGGSGQVNADDQERILTFTIRADWGNTAQANNIIIPDGTTDITGRLAVTVMDIADGATAGAPTVNFECITSTGVAAIGTGLDTAGEQQSNALPADCEGIQFDFAAVGGAGDATDEITLLVSVYIDNWPEV